jgi:hypothetical protein
MGHAPDNMTIGRLIEIMYVDYRHLIPDDAVIELVLPDGSSAPAEMTCGELRRIWAIHEKLLTEALSWRTPRRTFGT